MSNSALQQQIALTLLPNFGKRRVRTILNTVGNLDEFFKESKKSLAKISGISEKHVRLLDRDLALKQAENYLPFFENENIQSHFYTDESFPQKLNECVDAPLLLFSRGNMELNTPKIVAVVGTRNASPYGKAICEELIDALKDKNILVVSGLAYGIDVFTHRLCVQNKVQTLGILAHGLDRLYPSLHKATALEMTKNGGLLTEFLPGTNPDRENFPMRNRIVAGMADATIVIESGLKGGSLITAQLANDYNRDVFAFPGDVNREFSKGCNWLIQQNKAHLISSSSEFLKLMEWENSSKAKQLDLFENLNPKEKLILKCFKEKISLSFDQLINFTKMSFSELNSHLLNLEFEGILKPLAGKQYQSLIS